MTNATLTKADTQANIQKMDAAALELQRITEKTEFALSVVTQAIRTQEAVAKGKVLKQLREDIPDGEWMKFLNREDVRLNHKTALTYINAAQLMEDAGPLYGTDMLELMGARTLGRIQTLPTDAKLDLLDQVEETGKPLVEREVEEIAKTPEVKLSKTAEKLQEAKARKQNASTAHERHDADRAIKKYEDRILQLESELAREKEHKTELSDGLTSAEDDLHTATKKLEEAQAELAKALEESHNLRFDEDTARSQRVSRVGNQLILTLPQLLADLQKYVGEYEYFAETVQSAVSDQIKTLMAYLDEHFKSTETQEETKPTATGDR